MGTLPTPPNINFTSSTGNVPAVNPLFQPSSLLTNPIQGYAPPQWSSNSAGVIAPPLTIYVQNYSVQGSLSNTGPSPLTVNRQALSVLYVFDNALNAIHEQNLTITQNPVQTQASISDHSYLMPAKLTITILMSDSMQSYVPSQFTGTQGRSVSAYQALIELQKSQELLQLQTRLRQYSNMLITSIRPEEDASTRYGLRCTVTFQEILIAGGTYAGISQSTKSSAAPQVTYQSPTGPGQTAAVSESVTNANSTATNLSNSTKQSVNSAAAAGKSAALPQKGLNILSGAGSLISNLNQFPAAIQNLAQSIGLPVTGASNSLSSLPNVMTSLGGVFGVKIPVSVTAPLAKYLSVGANISNAAGNWSSNPTSTITTLVSSVSRY